MQVACPNGPYKVNPRKCPECEHYRGLKRLGGGIYVLCDYVNNNDERDEKLVDKVLKEDKELMEELKND